MHSFLWDAQEEEGLSNRVTPTVYPEPSTAVVVGRVFQVAVPSGSDDLQLGVKVSHSNIFINIIIVITFALPGGQTNFLSTDSDDFLLTASRRL